MLDKGLKIKVMAKLENTLPASVQIDIKKDLKIKIHDTGDYHMGIKS